MSNSVSRFTTDSYTSSDISSFYLYAYDGSHVAYIVFNNIASATKLRIYKRDLSSQTYSYDLTKEQITHLLSLDCPDAFIAYALTLCPCPPETVKPALDAVDGGIPLCPLCPFCGSTFYRDDLGSCYDCFFPSDDRGE